METLSPPLPIGNCKPGTTVTVQAHAIPASVTIGAKVQLSGVATETRVLPNCETTESPVAITWTLTFQPPGGSESNATHLLSGATTLTPSFIPLASGVYRATLTGESSTVGPKVAATNITALDPPPVLLESSGHVKFLRVHDLGSEFGPPTDELDVEAVVQLDSEPGKSFGFQLRNDKFRPSRQGQLDLLRDAFNNNWTVLIDYFIIPGKENGVVFRTALIKP